MKRAGTDAILDRCFIIVGISENLRAITGSSYFAEVYAFLKCSVSGAFGTVNIARDT